jgi:hypothetical protein
MKIYRLECCYKGALNQYHTSDPCRLVGLFTNIEEAEQLRKKIESITYDDSDRLKYDCYISEIETDTIVDKIVAKQLMEE